MALRVKHADFIRVLSHAVLAHEQVDREAVKVQWDPEHGPKLKFQYRSIQIGLPGDFSRQWANEWIYGIEDVTSKARALKEVVENEPNIEDEELSARGLLPLETVYDELVPANVKKKLNMLGTAVWWFATGWDWRQFRGHSRPSAVPTNLSITRQP